MKYDVIIIGSGLGGLECANILSRQGLSVLILERQTQYGGCMQSYKRHGASYDTGLHYVGGLDEGQPLYTTFKYLGLLDLPWQRLDENGFDRIYMPNDNIQTKSNKEFTEYLFKQGYKEFEDYFSDLFPHEKEALNKYIKLLRLSDANQLSSLTSNAQLEDLFNNSLFSTNAWQWLHENFHDETLINILSGNSLKLELHKKTLPLFTFLHGNGSYIQSSWRLKGDGNMLVNKLINEVKNNGGELKNNTEVIELIEKDGQIVSADCSNGEVYEGKTFISDTHPAITCSLVKNSRLIRNIYRQRMTRLENTFGMFTVSLRLKKDSIPYFNYNKYIYDTPDVWSLSEPESKNTGILVSCPTSGNQIDILSPMRWTDCNKWQDTTIGHRGEDYDMFKKKKAEHYISMAEEHIPGLRNSIIDIYTSTPLTYRDYNLAPNGNAYGIRKDCNMPIMTILTPRTPVPNLLMTGQNLMLHGLHGVTMTSLFTCAEILGKNAIQKIINDK